VTLALYKLFLLTGYLLTYIYLEHHQTWQATSEAAKKEHKEDRNYSGKTEWLLQSGTTLRLKFACAGTEVSTCD